MNIAWTIAGSDTAGFSGIQKDILTLQSLDVHACSIITAITSQNSTSIDAIHYTPEVQLTHQINALKNNYPAKAIKLGMLGNISIIAILKEYLSKYPNVIILDPVLFSSSGYPLFKEDLNTYVRNLKTIFHYIYLMTPNIYEAEVLTNTKIHTLADVKKAASILLSMGVKNVLIKGGHFHDTQFSHDYWTNGSEDLWLSSTRYTDKKTRGTGCMLSSAITAFISRGDSLPEALVKAKTFISTHIRTSKFAQLPIQTDLPWINKTPRSTTITPPFPTLGKPIGLYPIIDKIEWLELLSQTGITTIQLRIKNKTGEDLENEIKESISLANRYGIRLFINDYWQLAIKYNAYGVHLGQEDIQHVDLEQLLKSGLCLGVSTHSHEEVARAHAVKPSYIAVGPVFHTKSKIMPYSPQGIQQLEYWRRLLNYPIVAIGGINTKNILTVKNTGVDGVAMISAITQANNPFAVTQKLLGLFAG